MNILYMLNIHKKLWIHHIDSTIMKLILLLLCLSTVCLSRRQKYNGIFEIGSLSFEFSSFFFIIYMSMLYDKIISFIIFYNYTL